MSTNLIELISCYKACKDMQLNKAKDDLEKIITTVVKNTRKEVCARKPRVKKEATNAETETKEVPSNGAGV